MFRLITAPHFLSACCVRCHKSLRACHSPTVYTPFHDTLLLRHFHISPRWLHRELGGHPICSRAASKIWRIQPKVQHETEHRSRTCSDFQPWHMRFLPGDLFCGSYKPPSLYNIILWPLNFDLWASNKVDFFLLKRYSNPNVSKLEELVK
jgi:hypothetical protein